MVNHIVMYKLNNPTEEDAQKLKDVFLSMKGKIAELVEIDAGIDVLKTDRSFDVVLICKFHSLEDMAKYQQHPMHLPVKKIVQSMTQKAHSVDYII